jgi:hypothetical protein
MIFTLEPHKFFLHFEIKKNIMDDKETRPKSTLALFCLLLKALLGPKTIFTHTGKLFLTMGSSSLVESNSHNLLGMALASSNCLMGLLEIEVHLFGPQWKGPRHPSVGPSIPPC